VDSLPEKMEFSGVATAVGESAFLYLQFILVHPDTTWTCFRFMAVLILDDIARQNHSSRRAAQDWPPTTALIKFYLDTKNHSNHKILS